MLPYEVLFCIAALMLGAVGLYLLPRGCELRNCDCQKTHQASRIRGLAANIEKQHMTFHSKDRPQPTCSLCQSEKRDTE